MLNGERGGCATFVFSSKEQTLKNMFGLKAHAKCSLGWKRFDLNGAIQNFGISKF